MNKLVSILIPVHNAAPYLPFTIESALAQSWPDIEVIIVDDGSTDHSYEIASGYASDKVKVYRQEKRGACHARNKALRFSTGSYIQYLDGDDLLASDKIEKQMAIFERERDDRIIVSAAWIKFYDSLEELEAPELMIYRDYSSPLDMLMDMWLHKNMMQTSVWLTPRQIIEQTGDWDESLLLNQDGEFFCRVLAKGSSVRFSKDTPVYYRAHRKGSISTSGIDERKAASLLRSYQSYEQIALAMENSERVRNALAQNYYSFIYHYYHRFPALVKVAMEKVNEWGVRPPVIKGATTFNQLRSLFGFYNALRLRKLLQSGS